MRLVELDVSGVLLIEPDVHADDRGFFLETWHQRRYWEAGFPKYFFVQDNHSRSVRNVLRGLHFQKRSPQGKLVQVVRGNVFDVAVDIRVGSPHFGRWIGHELSDKNHRQLWIPPGFAHGFCTLSESADLTYKCTQVYEPDDDFGIIWCDKQLGIEWPIGKPLLSSKDKELPTLEDARHAGQLPHFCP